MTELERDIERALVGLAKRHGGMALKWVCPGWAGVPDRIMMLPGGRIIFIELKRPKGGHVERRQAWWHDKITALGFRCRVVKDRDGLARLEKEIRTTQTREQEIFREGFLEGYTEAER